MKVIGIVQARIGSSRLPGKILAPIVDGRPLLSVVVERLAPANIAWWLATSDRPEDDVTAAWGEELGIAVWRGDEQDVLSRFTGIVSEVQPDWVVRATADDPFTGGEIVRALIAAATAAPEDVDLIGDTAPARQFPLGYVPQAVRASALLRLTDAIPPDQAHHRTHVTSFLVPDRARAYADRRLPARPDWRWTVDTRDDLMMARKTFALFGPSWRDAGYAEIVELLDRHPELVAANTQVRQKAIEDG